VAPMVCGSHLVQTDMLLIVQHETQ
jgi:hypothetical protein